MPYYDNTKSITIQIRDKMRDLLEADGTVRRVYPAPLLIRSLPTDDVPKADELRVSLSIVGVERAIAIEGTYGTNNVNPMLCLTIQRYADNDDPEIDQSAAQDHCITVTDTIIAAILTRQADPTPGDCRLWDEMRFLPQTTMYRKMIGKFWASDTLFRLDSYQRT